MDFNLNEQQLMLREMVRDFAKAEVAPIAQEIDETERFPCEIVGKMGELGLLGVNFPEKYGGTAAGVLSHVIVLEELAVVEPTVAGIVDQDVSLAGYLLNHFGNEEQKQTWLVPLIQGKILGGFGLTEPEAGSDAAAITTTAILDRDSWIINGTKAFISNAGTDISALVLLAVVTGQRGDGRKEFSNIIVPKGTPGYNLGPCYRKFGLHAMDTRELSFVDCRVPAGNILGERGAGYRQMLSTLDEARIALAAIATGLAQGCLNASLNYAKERVQFGRPIFGFQAIQFKLVDMAVGVEASRLLTYKAAALEDEGKTFAQESAMAKLFASENATKAAEEAVQIHGGYGYISDFAVSRFYTAAKLFTIVEGTSEVQRTVIARGL